MSGRRTVSGWPFIACLLGSWPAAAQNASSAQPGSPAPAPTAVAAARGGRIEIDGRLDEAAWATAPVISAFTQREPKERAAPTQRTAVRVLFDQDALYLGARMFESGGASAVRSRLVRRDADPASDLLTIDLDPYRDRLHHVEFSVNPAGVRGDALDGDASWDPVWQAAAAVDAEGWTAELRIPLSQLRFSRDTLQSWGLQIRRVIQRLNETDMWAFVPLNENLDPSRYGVLEGLRFPHQPGHLELLPYVSARAERLSSADPASPFYAPHPSTVRAGGDLRYPITSSLTLSATVNPDFGQVEVDPAVVNLSAFETFFPEKRPFFVEGASLFDFGDPSCNINCGFGLFPFYTRRVGRPPQGGSLAFREGDYVDLPENTTILGAAKVTGRTQGGTSVGIMDAISGAQHARVATASGGIVKPLVEPLTNAFVARVQHEMRGGNLRLGAIATSAARRLGDAGIRALLPASANVGGVDGELYWGRHTYHLYAALIGSRVAGDSGAILRLQRSSARYFQRPDRQAGGGLLGAALDPSATSLAGYGFISRLEKQNGDWTGDLNTSVISPGYEPNDLGFLQRADYRWVNGTLGRQYTKPTRYYRSFSAMLGAEASWNFDGDLTARDATAVLAATLPNYWRFSLIGEAIGSLVDDRLTRGGPAVRRSGGIWLGLNGSTDARRSFYVSLSSNLARDPDGAFSRAANLTFTARPASNASISVGPAYEHTGVTDQYVTSVADPTATLFFGRRYIFAFLDQRLTSMTTRVNVTFSPALSLQAFAQPLLFKGRYSDYKEFARPHVRAKLIYGREVGTIAGSDGAVVLDPDAAGPAAPFTVDRPDEDFRSLRGTAVLRWEWRPGSTLYLAWTQTRAGSDGGADFDFPRPRRTILDERPDNIFLVKLSYWLGL